jgi:hypothetical protein
VVGTTVVGALELDDDVVTGAPGPDDAQAATTQATTTAAMRARLTIASCAAG